MSKADDLTVTVALVGASNVSDLKTEWLTLEQQAEASFFTTWSWIGCWLHGLALPAPLHLLRATRGGKVVGLALLFRSRSAYLKAWPIRCMHLHATGDPNVDAIMIERNGFLVHRSETAKIESAMYMHLLQSAWGWHQLRLPGLSPGTVIDGIAAQGFIVREQARQSFFVDLQEVRRRNGDYLGTLSSNCRQQVRRSIRAYAPLGTLTLTVAPDLESAMDYLTSMRVLHEKRWSEKGQPGAFSNPAFAEFHSRLIAAAFPRGEIQLLRIRAGSQVIGYLYNFVHRGRVLFYQSGFEYGLLESGGRPGLVTHTLAIAHNAALGHHTYDFLAGEAQYKRSLASSEECMVWVTVHRNTLAFRLDDALRKLKQRWTYAGAVAPARAPNRALKEFDVTTTLSNSAAASGRAEDPKVDHRTLP